MPEQASVALGGRSGDRCAPHSSPGIIQLPVQHLHKRATLRAPLVALFHSLPTLGRLVLSLRSRRNMDAVGYSHWLERSTCMPSGGKGSSQIHPCRFHLYFRLLNYLLGILRRICSLYHSAAEPLLYAVARPCSATQIEIRSSFSGTLPSFKDSLFVLHNTALPHFNLQVAFFLRVAFLVNDFYIRGLPIQCWPRPARLNTMVASTSRRT